MKSLYVFRTRSRELGSAREGRFWPRVAASGLWLVSSDIEVRLQAVAAALAAVTGLLVAAERRGRVELVERVGPDHAGPELVRDREDPRALLGPDAGGQPVRRVVGLL